MKLPKRWTWAIATAVMLFIFGLWGRVSFLDSSRDVRNSPYVGHGGTFKNPLSELDSPDPSIVYHQGFYYMTFTHNGTDIMVMKSRTVDFRNSERKIVWVPPLDTMYSSNLWAPEIQYLQGKWYIYFAADDGRNEHHRMYALQADTDDPLGSYTLKGKITDETDQWAIDGLVLEYEDRLYFVWSGWEGDVNVQQNTYIAPMRDPLTISGARVLISEPDRDWERIGGPPYINEGQAILKNDGRVFLFYSGAGSWTPSYSIGALVLHEGGDPLDPNAWHKLDQPLLRMDEDAGVYGPGHNTIVKSPDGTQDWIVYHATSGMQDGWNNRKARAQLIHWGEDGMPTIGKPLPLQTAIPLPRGSGVFSAAFSSMNKGVLEFRDIPSTIKANSPILVHYRNGTSDNVSVPVFTNGIKTAELLLHPTKNKDIGYAYASADLITGMNTIGLSTLREGIRIEAIELPLFETENGEEGEFSKVVNNPFASSGRAVMFEPSENGRSALRLLNVNVPLSGEYMIKAIVSNPWGEEAEFVLRASEDEVTLTVPITDRNDFSVIEGRIDLSSGENKLFINGPSARIMIDRFEIYRK